MPNIDPNDMMARLVAIEEEILTSDVVAYPFSQGEGDAYWTNYMPILTLDQSANEYGEEITEGLATIIATLDLGNLTAGVAGEREALLTQLFFDASRYFNARPKLQSEKYPLGMPFSHFMECRSVQRVTGRAEGDSRLLIQFTLLAHLFEPLQFAYY